MKNDGISKEGYFDVNNIHVSEGSYSYDGISRDGYFDWNNKSEGSYSYDGISRDVFFLLETREKEI